MNYITKAITFRVPQDIAKVLEKHYPQIYVEDMERINILVQEELAEANRRQARENRLDDINGGSK